MVENVKVVIAGKPRKAPAALRTRLTPIPEENAEKVELRFTRSKAAKRSSGRLLPDSDSGTLESDAIVATPPAVYDKRALGARIQCRRASLMAS